MDKIIGIYKITNIINNKSYIGQSIDIERRFKEHKESNRTSKYLRRAINKYGLNNFTFEILEECDEKDLSEKEKFWIKYYDSVPPKGYNLTKGGDGGNTFQYLSKEELQKTKERISQVTTGEKNGFYGKHHTEKTKEYLRKINKGKVMSEETKKKLSQSLQGHYMPESAKDKISKATKKQWENEAFRNLMRHTHKGNEYAKGNKWNVGRIDVYNPKTHEHKRIFSKDLSTYINNGYIKGVPPDDKRHNPNIKRCSETSLVGVCYNKKENKWLAYISYKKNRYGIKLFIDKKDAIKHRQYLENILLKILDSNIDIEKINFKESFKTGSIVLYGD